MSGALHRCSRLQEILRGLCNDKRDSAPTQRLRWSPRCQAGAALSVVKTR